MSRVRIAICDDDRNFCEVLKDEVLEMLHSKSSEAVIVDVFSDSENFTQEIKKHNYDIAFLDIDMPKIGGFEVAETLSAKLPACHFVFVTSHDMLVFEAIKKHPFGFVRKSKLREELVPLIEDFLSENSYKQQHYAIKKYSEVTRIPLCQIKYIEAKGNSVIFHTEDDNISKKGKISDVEKELPATQFVRIGRSYIVNLAFVYGSVKASRLTLKTGEELPLGRDRVQNVKDAYMSYLRGGI